MKRTHLQHGIAGAVFLVIAAIALVPALLLPARGQALGTAGTLTGVVQDPSQAVVPGALVEIQNPVTGFIATAKTDQSGSFQIGNIPPNPYHLSVTAHGFQLLQQDVEIRSNVPVHLALHLKVGKGGTAVTVTGEAGDLIETDPTAHTDIDRSLTTRLPIQGGTSGLSNVLTLATPGVAADSNGMFHPLGEHADTSFSIDNQPITDQQSRTFSNQLPTEAIQSMEVVTGVPPAEFGDKSSLVAQVITRSGLGHAPTGTLNLGYGSFGSPMANLTFSVGGANLGNFISIDGLRSGRFLDSPEFQPLHDVGNVFDIFDRVDVQPGGANSYHLDLSASRSWFQIPNTYNQDAVGQDQRQRLVSFNIAPGFTHLFSPEMLLTGNAYLRQDQVGYFPSANPFSDLPAALRQHRVLTNVGGKLDLSYVKGVHNFKTGVEISNTPLTEHFALGITDPAFNPVCLDNAGNPVTTPTLTNSNQCAGAGFEINPNLSPGLIPFDLSRGGSLFIFNGHTDIKEESAYLEDTVTLGNWTLMGGVRGDRYDGITHDGAIEPRLGFSYLIHSTNTVLRGSYGRLMETPYNENLILSSVTGAGGLAQNTFGAFGEKPIKPGFRNQYDLGLDQAINRHLAFKSDYFWKYTNTDFDFDVLFNTPLTFPIEWRKSKIDGLSMRLNLLNYHGLSGFLAAGHVRSRFFGPEVGGILFNSPLNNDVFRIDHDQAYNQTAYLQYQVPSHRLRNPWIGLTWRYDSGLVAGSIPDMASALALNGDQQAAIGLFCGSTFATVDQPIRSCSSSNFGTTRVRIPAPGTENDDTNPPRIAPRNLIDLGIGWDNLFETGKVRWKIQLTGTNLTNTESLYNFLSTFSGTHFVAPRTWQAQVGMVF